MKILKQCLISATAIVLVLLAIWVLFRPVKVISVVKADQETPSSGRDDLDRLIDQLAWCESRNDPFAVNPADPVTRSVGLLQFKDDTFWRYNEIYKILPDLERHEIPNVIFEAEAQRALAKEIIKDGGWSNWRNCLKRYFL